MLTLKPLSVDWSVAGAEIPAVTFIAQAGLTTRELAHMLDSLVRVSRRVEKNHFVIDYVTGACSNSQKRPRTEARTRKP